MNRALKQTSIRLALLLRGASCDEAISTDRAVNGGCNIPQSAIHLKLDHMASDVQALEAMRYGGRDWD